MVGALRLPPSLLARQALFTQSPLLLHTVVVWGGCLRGQCLRNSCSPCCSNCSCCYCSCCFLSWYTCTHTLRHTYGDLGRDRLSAEPVQTFLQQLQLLGSVSKFCMPCCHHAFTHSGAIRVRVFCCVAACPRYGNTLTHTVGGATGSESLSAGSFAASFCSNCSCWCLGQPCCMHDLLAHLGAILVRLFVVRGLSPRFLGPIPCGHDARPALSIAPAATFLEFASAACTAHLHAASVTHSGGSVGRERLSAEPLQAVLQQMQLLFVSWHTCSHTCYHAQCWCWWWFAQRVVACLRFFMRQTLFPEWVCPCVHCTRTLCHT